MKIRSILLGVCLMNIWSNTLPAKSVAWSMWSCIALVCLCPLLRCACVQQPAASSTLAVTRPPWPQDPRRRHPQNPRRPRELVRANRLWELAVGVALAWRGPFRRRKRVGNCRHQPSQGKKPSRSLPRAPSR
jgi:hypothetical protein